MHEEFRKIGHKAAMKTIENKFDAMADSGGGEIKVGIPKVRKMVVIAALVGFGLNASLTLYMHDMMGLESYLAWVSDNWVELSPWIGVGLVALHAYALWDLIKASSNGDLDVSRVHALADIMLVYYKANRSFNSLTEGDGKVDNPQDKGGDS